MSKRKTIYSALPIVAAAYGEKFGVKVAIGGDVAHTDGQTIVVPNIPDSYPHMDAVWGYLAHEAAHVRLTDFSVQRRVGIHADLSNILEDCRIEQGMIEIYPGTAQTLHEVARYMAHAGHYHHVTAEEHPASILEGFCLYWLQSQVVGQTALQPYLDSAKQALEATFPRGVVVRLNALLRKAAGAQSTAEAVALTEEIMKMLEEEQQKEEKKPKGQDKNPGQDQQQQSSSSDSQGGKGQSEGQQDSSGQNSNQGDQQSSADQSKGAANGQAGKKPANAGAGNPNDEPSKMDQPNPADQSGSPQSGNGTKGDRMNGAGSGEAKNAADVIKQVLQAQGDDLLGDAHESLRKELEKSAEAGGDPHYQTVREALASPKHPKGRELVDSVKSTTSKIRSQLYGLVQASQRSGVRNKRSGKRLDTRSLCRVVAGDTRVFRSPIERQRPNTAVHILVDMSGSMQRPVSRDREAKSREQVAREASLALALALEPIPGVTPAVTYFKGGRSQPSFSVVKHGENVLNQSGRFMLGAGGGTPMAEAIWYAAYELSKTREERKMMIVVTDGEPNRVAPCKAVIDLCERSDIDMIGIGIETSAVTSLFQKNIVIDDATDLRRTLFKLMERSLIVTAA
jgi:nitric oxide reductase activation protein